VEVLENLRRVLRAQKELLGSEVALVKAITDAAPELGGIERRKLRAILGSDRKRSDSSDISLRFSELQVLHAYLLSRGIGGFGSLLTRPTLLRSVADRRKVAFLVPSKQLALERTTAVIHWDLRAMIAILRELERIDPGINIIVEDVLLQEKPVTLFNNSSGDQTWRNLLTGEDAPSLICIGSPRANHAAEILLAKMYNIPPFSPSEATRSLPFRFFWQTENKPSSFAVTENELIAHRQKLEKFIAWGKCSAVVVRSDRDEECLVIDRDETSQSWKTHGIIAAQRQENGQLWVVVAGLEGPASLGAAKEVASLDGVPSDDVMQYYVTHEVHFENAPSGQKKDARELGRLVKKQQWFMNRISGAGPAADQARLLSTRE
jgi:hypothetical protein